MAEGDGERLRDDDLERLVERGMGRTTLIVGAADTGKTTLSRALLERVRARGSPAALLSADPGQPSAGVPTCLALAVEPPWDRAEALWFAGGVTPAGNLLPVVLGVARLAARARSLGVATLIVDTSGLVDVAVGRVLQYHTALAAEARGVVAIERVGELDAVVRLLVSIGLDVRRRRTAPEARQRSPEQRRAYRNALLEEHLRGAPPVKIDASRLVDADWMPGSGAGQPAVQAGTIAGLLDAGGFCMGLGVVEGIAGGELTLRTAVTDPDAAVAVRLSRLRTDDR